MIIASWNCTGAGNKNFPSIVRDLTKTERIDILCLIETRISGPRAEMVIRKMGFNNWLRLEASGFAGGIWVLWNEDDFRLSYKFSSTQLIHCEVFDKKHNESLAATFVYGETTAIKRIKLWEDIRSIGASMTGAWVVMGDFNAYLTAQDKIGGAAPPLQAMRQFSDCVYESQLLEIPYIGDRCTWENHGIRERLDWGFCNLLWEMQHPEYKLIHKLKYKSDHRLIILADRLTTPRPKSNKRFLYHSAWALEETFSDVVRSSWEGQEWSQGRHTFERNSIKWSMEKIGNIPQKKFKLLRRLEGIDITRRNNQSTGLFKLEKELWAEYNRLITQEELMWYQRSRCKWLRWGDKNTSFFHASTRIRKKRQVVECLRNDAGVWIDDQTVLKSMAENFFRDLYTSDGVARDPSIYHADFPPLLPQDMELLHKEIHDTEIKNAAFMMGALKAPGPDGLHAHFFHSQWNQIGAKVCQLIREIWHDPNKVRSINHTNIVLLPKVDRPESMRDFRPISLCNVIFKIITKLIANRLKQCMQYLIRPEQRSFIAGRQSSDNIIIAQEAIHTMRNKKRANGYVAIKVDMEKAYDRLDWQFLRNTLECVGADRKLVDLIMACTSLTTMQVLWNGETSESFSPSRGVRQGDPLSPYLFVLCMERLGQMITKKVREGTWKGLKFNKQSPTISHLFFADDLILFGEASEAQIELMRSVMQQFCEVSGHKINLDKSKAFFSKNVHMNRALHLSLNLGIGITGDLGKYLGVPLLHNRATKATFHPIILKTQKRLSTWKGRYLTMAGRTTLIKSVLSTIPSYHMHTTLLPKGVLKDLEKISRDFLWNQSQEGRKLHTVAWNQIKQEKAHGGLGIKDLQRQNQAYIMKLCWGLISKPEELWVRCLKSKYGCGSDKYPAVYKKQNSSGIWNSITTVWSRFYKAIGRKPKGGGTTSFWWDLWTPLEEPLINFVEDGLQLVDPEASVRQYVRDDHSWDRAKMAQTLPHWIINTICKLKPPRGEESDIFVWRKSSDNNFSVKSAYSWLSNQQAQLTVIPWKKVWKMPVPEKVKVFLWQMFQEKLPTNAFRYKIGVATTQECPFECHGEENTLHIMRDCEMARNVWLLFVPTNNRFSFFCSNLQVWLKENMTRNFGAYNRDQVPWSQTFATVCWILWKTRCKGIMEGSRPQAKEIQHHAMFQLMEDRLSSTYKHQIFNNHFQENHTWTAPSTGFVRLDTDGSVTQQLTGACGGVIRDSHGHWLLGFQHQLGFVPNTSAELLGIHKGLSLCKQHGYSKVIAYTDSMEALRLLMYEGSINHPLREEINNIRDCLYSGWQVELRYTPRENVRCADYLARTAHEMTEESHIWFAPHPGCREILQEDHSAAIGSTIGPLS